MDSDWLLQCKKWQEEYPVVKSEYRNSRLLNPYTFMEQLFEQLREDDIIVLANGSASVVGFQAAKILEGQRLYTNGGSAAMGWGIGAAIGAARGAEKGQRVVLLEGDGSLQMSVGDLATIAHNNLNIRIFVLSNNGYHSIRQTQDRFFAGRHAGIDSETGVGFPDLKFLAAAYGLQYDKITEPNFWLNDAYTHPALIEVSIDPGAVFLPRIRFPMEEV